MGKAECGKQSFVWLRRGVGMSPLCTRMVLTHLNCVPPKGQSQPCPPKRKGPQAVCDTECINKHGFVGLNRNSKPRPLLDPAFYFPSPTLLCLHPHLEGMAVHVPRLVAQLPGLVVPLPGLVILPLELVGLFPTSPW